MRAPFVAVSGLQATAMRANAHCDMRAPAGLAVPW